ncbi:hypothetical protein TREVI0001_1370 [Treponema vincentii ATCC 35580]|uniref:Bacterial repeat domain-containing protein n=1 Tax=Treponema vincentii ATCC 35580 TaxID=596324 RepID=C8PLU2_9SPIR|nr:hypothetical protein TREVI0001_1370 [Treponema vincentii ATCC 35580]
MSFEKLPPELFAVNFSIDGGNGTLKATVDGSEINSGNKVEHGKTVTFTATPDAGYTVKEWKADGSAVTGSTSNTYTCTVTKALTVKVSFLAGGASYTVKHYQGKNRRRLSCRTGRKRKSKRHGRSQRRIHGENLRGFYISAYPYQSKQHRTDRRHDKC